MAIKATTTTHPGFKVQNPLQRSTDPRAGIVLGKAETTHNPRSSPKLAARTPSPIIRSSTSLDRKVAPFSPGSLRRESRHYHSHRRRSSTEVRKRALACCSQHLAGCTEFCAGQHLTRDEDITAEIRELIEEMARLDFDDDVEMREIGIFGGFCIKNHAIHDPLLTQLGEQQCLNLQEDFPYNDSIDLIVASPIRRTIYTALLSFDHVIKSKGLQVIGLPELQETSDLPCDTGSSPANLEKEFEGKPVDLTFVSEGWNIKQGRFAPTVEDIRERAKDARQWLMSRPERNIVVVTHGGFLHYLTEDWTNATKFAGTGWANTEYRSYAFETVRQPGDAHLVETAASKHRRHPQPLDHNEKAQLKHTVGESAADKAQSAQRIQSKV